MAAGVDTTKRKPRQLRGTPAYKFGNLFSGIILSIGIVSGLLLNQIDLIGALKTKFNIDLVNVSDEEKDKRDLLKLSLFKPNTSATLSKLIEEKDNLFKERKKSTDEISKFFSKDDKDCAPSLNNSSNNQLLPSSSSLKISPQKSNDSKAFVSPISNGIIKENETHSIQIKDSSISANPTTTPTISNFFQLTKNTTKDNNCLTDKSKIIKITPSQRRQAKKLSTPKRSKLDIRNSMKMYEFLSDDLTKKRVNANSLTVKPNKKQKKTDDYEIFTVPSGGNVKRKKWLNVNTKLTKRNPQVQDIMHNSKIKKILHINSSSQETIFDEIMCPSLVISRYLVRFYFPESNIYKKNYRQDVLQLEDFYSGDLCEQTVNECGCLLKDWSKIPGRCASPELKTLPSRQKNNTNEIVINKSEIDKVPPAEQVNEMDIDSNINCFTLPESNTISSRQCNNLQENTPSKSQAEEIPSQQQSVLNSNASCTKMCDKNNPTPSIDQFSRESSPDMFAEYETENSDMSTEDNINISPIKLNLNLTSCNENAFEVIQNYSRSLEIQHDLSDKTENVEKTDSFRANQSLRFSANRNMSNITGLCLENIGTDESKITIKMSETKLQSISKSSSSSSPQKLHQNLYDDSNNVLDGTEILFSPINDKENNSQNSSEPFESQISNESLQNDESLFINSENCNKVQNEDFKSEKDEYSQNKKKLFSPTSSQEIIILTDSDSESSQSKKNQNLSAVPNESFTYELESDYIDKLLENSLTDADALSKSNENDMHKIFDETMTTSPTKDDELLDMINQSVANLFDLSATISERSNHLAAPFGKKSKYSEFLDISISTQPTFDNHQHNNDNNDSIMDDEIDKLVHEYSFTQPVPETISTFDSLANTTKSISSVKDFSNILTNQESTNFEICHDGQTFFVKSGNNVSPKPDYFRMDSPTRAIHLKKYGLKPLKKHKAVICLEHIYNRLHPYIAIDNDDSPKKTIEFKKKLSEESTKVSTISSATMFSTVMHADFSDYNHENQTFFLPSAPSKKPWCLQPLHIAWYNLLNENVSLQESVLQYQPFDLAKIKKLFKDIGLIYNLNDLKSFFDRQCITFQTDNSRNIRKKVASQKIG